MAAAATTVLKGPKRHVNERTASFRLLRAFFQARTNSVYLIAYQSGTSNNQRSLFVCV